MTNENVDQEVRDMTLRAKLKADAQGKPIRAFLQYDYFKQNTGATGHDGDYDLFGGEVLELRHSYCLRVQIPEGFTREEALEGLARIREWLEGDDELWERQQVRLAEKRQRTFRGIVSRAKMISNNDNDDDIPF